MEIASTVALNGPDDLSLAYTPGVARVCEAIADDPRWSGDYTWVSNTVAVVTDGTAVLGLGDIGPRGRDAGDGGQGRAVQAVRRRRRGADLPGHHRRRRDRRDRRPAGAELRRDQPRGHLRARAASRSRTGSRSELDIPVFHDDQHGTAVVALAALRERAAAHRQVPRTTRGRRSPAPVRPASRWPGSCSPPASRTSPSSTARACCTRDRDDLTPVKRPLAADTADQTGRSGSLATVHGRAPTSSSASPAAPCPRRSWPRWPTDAIIFGLANPNPEVHPEVAHKYARVVATGRSDFPNQINNVLAFPGIFRGAFDVPRHARSPRG